MEHRLALLHLVLLFLLAVCHVTPISRNNQLSIAALERYRYSAEEWLTLVNQDLEQMAQKNSLLLWQISTNQTEEAVKELSIQEMRYAEYSMIMCQQRDEWVVELLSSIQQRMMAKLCRGSQLNQEQTEALVETTSRLQAIYSGAIVSVAGHNYTGESEVNNIMKNSRDYSILLQTWSGWHSAVGPPSKEYFRQMIEIGNMGAKAAGYHDTSEIWKGELGIDKLEKVVDELYTEIEPLYIQLYSFVRGRLASIDKTGAVRPEEPLPAHILGNLWAQNWEPLLPLLLQTNAFTGMGEATRVLRRRYKTVQQLAEVAQDFFISLGFEPLPPTFWSLSQFVRPRDGRKPICHGSAVNFYNHQDVRLLMCGQVNEDDLYTLHHEMGHLYYFLSYRHQPYLFRTGANSAFHEAIGDAIIYGAMATEHRKRLGFLTPDIDIKREEIEIVNLLRQALVKIPLLPFSLALEKWRWNVMTGSIKPENYNRAWWDFKFKYQGIVSPITRSEKDFDPASKFHIISNTPYIRYFMSGVLQVQIFQALCEVSKQGPRFGKPLSQCDIYGSIEAGNRLRIMMSVGGSQPWDLALKILNHNERPKLDAKPLMEYFRPLHEWLLSENRRSNYTIGFR